MTFLYALLLLGILIFVHEFGHFLAAKLLGVRVLKFSLGFGPALLKKKYGDTEYLLSSVPLGGYVKMLGESLEEELKEEEKLMAYNYQPVWKRFFIVFSGPLFNLVFAVFIFFFIFLHGLPVMLPEVKDIVPQSPAERVGIMKGDTIIAIDGSPVNQWDEMTKIIHNSPGKELSVEIKRSNEVIKISVTPEKKTIKDIFGQEKEIGIIGITPSGKTFMKQQGLFQAVNNAIQRTWEVSVLTLVAIVKLIQRVIPADTIGGPILIFQMAGEQASLGFLNFFVFMAVISINLGVLNLLPIPILDGGHVLFLGIEAIRRKPLNEKFIKVTHGVGLAIIILIITLATYNDIMRLITGKTIP
ncbi:MAG: RIP metalloprotease RseP [Nitrospirota bacterium]|nr:RIP metalloprotease RseP [Nitrospirota bacterium]MDH5768546.1 RIP metalloprotease RseP [Nitrospirota bacterium]